MGADDPMSRPDFGKVLASRHGENDTICVTAYKVRDGSRSGTSGT